MAKVDTSVGNASIYNISVAMQHDLYTFARVYLGERGVYMSRVVNTIYLALACGDIIIPYMHNLSGKLNKVDCVPFEASVKIPLLDRYGNQINSTVFTDDLEQKGFTEDELVKFGKIYR